MLPGNPKIPFNVPTITGRELDYIQQVIRNCKFSGDGEFANKCHHWLRATLDCFSALLTPSCTHALEMAALLINIKAGDEVIMPSFTFTSTANAFALRGARIVFVDIRPDTMNIDETLIETAITEKTKAIVPVHYAGVACEMDVIMEIARRHNLFVIEDAAQALMSTYKGRHCGTLGHLGCFSFHETKNIQCGEGGALIINDPQYVERAETIREKGTDRSKFWRGEVDKYSWKDIGSSYILSELNAAFLFAQLENAHEITSDRIATWNYYYNCLISLSGSDYYELPKFPCACTSNGHIFYIKLVDESRTNRFLEYSKSENVTCIFHYLPLHDSHAGVRNSRFFGLDSFTSRESRRLVRLPLYYNMQKDDMLRVVNTIADFFK